MAAIVLLAASAAGTSAQSVSLVVPPAGPAREAFQALEEGRYKDADAAFARALAAAPDDPGAPAGRRPRRPPPQRRRARPRAADPRAADRPRAHAGVAAAGHDAVRGRRPRRRDSRLRRRPGARAGSGADAGEGGGVAKGGRAARAASGGPRAATSRCSSRDRRRKRRPPPPSTSWRARTPASATCCRRSRPSPSRSCSTRSSSSATSRGRPGWSGGLFDGRIRLPIRGGLADRREFERVLTHEYVHALVHSVAAGGVPAWLNEGLAAAARAGRDGARRAGTLHGARSCRWASSARRSPPCLRPAVPAAYAGSALAVQDILDRVGAPRLMGLLSGPWRGRGLRPRLHGLGADALRRLRAGVARQPAGSAHTRLTRRRGRFIAACRRHSPSPPLLL